MASRSKRQRPPFKACRKCKFLVPHEEEQCPKCGSRDFAEEWEGMIIIVDPNDSELANIIGINSAGRYAIKVR